MIRRFIRSLKREWLWKLLLSRSVVHTYWSPQRSNTIHAVSLLLVSVPFAVLVFPLLLVRVLVSGRIDLYEFRIQNQFAWLVDHFERVRGSRSGGAAGVVVVVRSTFRHRGLAHLYRSRLRCLVLWSTGLSSWCAQVLLLQPRFVISRTILHSRNYFSLDMAVEPLSPSRQLVRLREKTLVELGCSQSRYVTLAVFTSTSEELADPEYASRTQPRETIGSDMADSIDFLRANGVDVIMLGFPDHGKAHVPRVMPRLSEFGEVGGLLEVALASGCLYFWADCVGAQWLRQPFKRWGLITNVDEKISGVRKINLPQSVIEKDLITLLRYQTPGGNLLTLREAISHESCFAAVAKGELIAIRNSPTDFVDAHHEMLSRVKGTWAPDSRMEILQDRLNQFYSDIPEINPMPIALSFLSRYPYLLD